MARKAGVGERAIRKAECGHNPRANPLTIRKIAGALNAQPHEIAEFAGRYPAPAARPDGPRPLREIRQQAYLAVIEVAALSEVTYGTITAIELHTHVPRSTATMQMIAEALGVQVSDISEFEIKREQD